MYDAFRGVDGPGAEAICSDILLLTKVTKLSSLLTS